MRPSTSGSCAALAGAWMLAACAFAQPRATEFPIGTTFAWIGTGESGKPLSAPPDPSRYTLRFDASGRAVIRLDCNRGSAKWTRDGDRLSFAPVASTKMLCPPGSLDAAFAADLAQVAAWRLDGGELTLSGRDGAAMRFRPLPP